MLELIMAVLLIGGGDSVEDPAPFSGECERPPIVCEVVEGDEYCYPIDLPPCKPLQPACGCDPTN